MKRKQVFIVALLSLFLCGCFNMQAPEISYISTDFKPVDFQNIKANINFQMYNPNMVPLKGVIDYQLNVNGQELFSGASSEIEADSQKNTAFTLTSEINLPKTFGSINELLKSLGSGKDNIPFEMNGLYRTTVFGNEVKAPLKAAGSIPLPKLPKIDLQGISVGQLDLKNATLKINAKITNNNSVPLNLESFLYNLVGEGKTLVESKLDKPLQLGPNESSEIAWDVKVDLSKLDATLVKKLLNNSLSLDLQKEFENIH